MPVSTKIGFLGRYGHHMTETRRYVAVAAWAQIAFGGLIRLNEANLDVFGVGWVGLSPGPSHQSIAHTRRAAITTTPRPTNQ